MISIDKEFIPIPEAGKGGRREVASDIVVLAARERMTGKFKSDYAAAKFYLPEYCPECVELSDKQYENKLKFLAKKIKLKREESAVSNE